MKNENTAEKKEYGNLRIISLDGSQIYRRADGRCGLAPYSTLKDGKLNPDAFGGILDESLDTDKLCEVYEKHKVELPFAYTENGNYTRALVSVSFDYAVKEFEPYKPKIRKSGTGCVTMINDHLYEGRFTPRVNGKRISKNVYAKTREECEEKLALQYLHRYKPKHSIWNILIHIPVYLYSILFVFVICPDRCI